MSYGRFPQWEEVRGRQRLDGVFCGKCRRHIQLQNGVCPICGELPVHRGYRLNEDDLLRRHVIMKLMCDFELTFSQIEKEFNINFKEYFNFGLNNLKEMSDDGLVSITDDKIVINDMGRLLIRNIAINFDGYIERKEDNARYSRTV